MAIFGIGLPTRMRSSAIQSIPFCKQGIAIFADPSHRDSMMATSQLSPDNPQIQKGYLSLSILRRDMTMRRIVISVHTDNYALSSKQRAQIQPPS